MTNDFLIVILGNAPLGYEWLYPVLGFIFFMLITKHILNLFYIFFNITKVFKH